MLDKLQAGKTLTVRLKSVWQEQYLYADADQFNKNDQLRSVFTCRTSKDPKVGNWANWKITANFTPFGTMTVRVASEAYNNELLADKLGMNFYESPSTGTRRYLYTLRDKSTSPRKQGAVVDWYLDADPSGVANRYIFRSLLLNELIYAPSRSWALDDERLNIFTWALSGGKNDFTSDFDKLLWDIEIVSESP